MTGDDAPIQGWSNGKAKPKIRRMKYGAKYLILSFIFVVEFASLHAAESKVLRRSYKCLFDVNYKKEKIKSPMEIELAEIVSSDLKSRSLRAQKVSKIDSEAIQYLAYASLPIPGRPTGLGSEHYNRGNPVITPWEIFTAGNAQFKHKEYSAIRPSPQTVRVAQVDWPYEPSSFKKLSIANVYPSLLTTYSYLQERRVFCRDGEFLPENFCRKVRIIEKFNSEKKKYKMADQNSSQFHEILLTLACSSNMAPVEIDCRPCKLSL